MKKARQKIKPKENRIETRGRKPKAKSIIDIYNEIKQSESKAKKHNTEYLDDYAFEITTSPVQIPINRQEKLKALELRSELIDEISKLKSKLSVLTKVCITDQIETAQKIYHLKNKETNEMELYDENGVLIHSRPIEENETSKRLFEHDSEEE